MAALRRAVEEAEDSERRNPRSREQVCTVDGVWIDATERERHGRVVWGAGRLAEMREEASKNPLLIHVLDTAARLLGVPVVDNTPTCPFTRLYVREALDASGAFGDLFSGPSTLLFGGSYGPQGACRVKIPDHATPGQYLQLPVPPGWPKSGETMTFLVPSNAKPGDLCYAPLPHDEVIGARSREWTAAAQRTRLKQLHVREAKTDQAADRKSVV